VLWYCQACLKNSGLQEDNLHTWQVITVLKSSGRRSIHQRPHWHEWRGTTNSFVNEVPLCIVLQRESPCAVIFLYFFLTCNLHYNLRINEERDWKLKLKQEDFLYCESLRIIIIQGVPGGKLIFWEVIVLVILRKKVYMYTQRYWVFGLCPSSGFFLNNNEKTL
jgi:hypothetical protein